MVVDVISIVYTVCYIEVYSIEYTVENLTIIMILSKYFKEFRTITCE